MEMQDARNFAFSFRTYNSDKIIRDTTVTGNVNINHALLTNVLTLNNIHFKDSFTIKRSSFKGKLVFNNCQIDSELHLISIATNSEENQKDSYPDIIFQNCTINKIVIINNCKIINGISIKDNCRIAQLCINDLLIEKGSLQISKSNIKQLTGNRLEVYDKIKLFENCFFEKEFKLLNISCNEFEIENCKFKESTHINTIKSIKYIIYKCEFHKDFTGSCRGGMSELKLLETKFRKDAYFHLTPKKETEITNELNFYLSSVICESSFSLNGTNRVFNEFQVHFTKDIKGLFVLRSLNIKKCRLTGYNFHSQFEFNNSKIYFLQITDFFNYDRLSFFNLKYFGDESEISISKSDLGKTSIYNTNLDNFKEINIIESILLEVIYSNVIWFSEKKLNLNKDLGGILCDETKEVYRQLKLVAEKQGDKTQALDFRAKEINAYRNTIRKRFPKRMINDKTILFLGLTNNFGLSWLRAMILTICFVVILHFAIIISMSSELSFIPATSKSDIILTWDIYKSNLSTLPTFVDPTHDLSKIYPYHTFSFWTNFYDLLLKIGLAFFIYQIVISFRKFSKN
ncbi:MAG: hypothetical protein K9H64_10200 [Bacteroidales bacterium]|nr:hypothetical protein [Bacteroidales bacterium]MCF8456239.1 hypothetical protein [Bacteroidales bacterium]